MTLILLLFLKYIDSGVLATEKEGNYFRFLALISISANAMRKAFDNLPYSFEDLLKRFKQTAARGHPQIKQLPQSNDFSCKHST